MANILEEKIQGWFLDETIHEAGHQFKEECFNAFKEAYNSKAEEPVSDDTYLRFLFASGFTNFSKDKFDELLAEDPERLAWYIPGGAGTDIKRTDESEEDDNDDNDDNDDDIDPIKPDQGTSEPATLTLAPASVAVNANATLTASLQSGVENPSFTWSLPAIVTSTETSNTNTITITGVTVGTGIATVEAGGITATSIITVTE